MVLLLFILGLCSGSFLGVLVDRLPRNETVLKGRSHCEFCKKELRWLDLIPVISFFLTLGRCRYCQRKLPLFYPAIELSTGIMFTLVYVFLIPNQIINYQLSIINLLYYLIIISGFVVIFFMDLKYGLILNKILLPLTVIILLYLLFLNPSSLIINLLCGLASCLFFFIAALLFKLVRGKDGMGGGDIKLAFVLGLFLGFPGILVCLYLAFLTAAGWGIILILWSRKSLKTASLPFGTFLVFATIITLFLGDFLFQKALILLGL